METPERRVVARAVLGLGVVGSLVWVVTAIALANRGFGGPNEGYYLLSYRYWDSTPRTQSMAQYFYGPLFELLGYDVARLRIARVVTIVAVHAFFGWQLMAWLRSVRPGLHTSRLWMWTGTASVVAVGAIIYGWLPATPGYNDITVLGTIVILACALRMLRRAADGAPPGVGASAAIGASAAVMILCKATMVVSVVILVIALAVLLRRAGAGVGRLAVGLLLGGSAVLLGLHLFVKPLDEALPPMLETLRVVSSTGHRPTDLVVSYARTTAQALGLGLAFFVLPGLVTVWLARRVARRRPAEAAALGLLVTLVIIGLLGGLRGGLTHVGAYQAAIVAMVLIALLVALRAGARRQRGVPEATLMLVGPPLAALGTNNPLLAIAVGAAALWLGVVLWAATAIPPAARTSRAVAVSAAVGLVVVCVLVGVTGVTHGRRGVPLHGTDSGVLPGVPLLASVRLPRGQLHTAIELRQALASEIQPPGRRMIAFGELADQILLLGGRPVGNAWFSNPEDGLQAADLRAACRHGNPWGARQPLVLANRDLTSREMAGFRACGLDVARDYRQLAMPGVSIAFRVLAPIG